MLERQIESADRNTGRLMYELYGFSEEEIRLVSGATAYWRVRKAEGERGMTTRSWERG